MNNELALLLTGLIDMIESYRMSCLLFLSIALGTGGAWLVAGTSFREHLLDEPNDRSSHQTPTPRGGGVGILATFILVSLVTAIPKSFILAVLFISFISLYGDLFRISAKIRLTIHFVCTLIFLIPLVFDLISLLNLPSLTLNPVIPIFATVLLLVYVVGTANFYNFMDGINGIAGVSGVIAFGLLGGYTLFLSPPDAFHKEFAFLSLCIAFACAGFLPFNMPRARVFMGDVGSILLGFVYAACVVVLSRNYIEAICFASILFLFYADELTTMYVRVRSGESLLTPHRRHLYQLLANEYGMSHWKVTTLYGTVQVIVGASFLAVSSMGIYVVISLLGLFFLIFILVTYSVRKKLSGNNVFHKSNVL